MMTKIQHHPSFKQIRKRLIIEAFFILSFALIYWEAFDGHLKPIIANIALFIGMLVYLGNHLLSLWWLPKVFSGETIKASIQQYSKRLQLIASLSMATSFTFGLCLIYFFSSTIQFTINKYLILAGIIATLIVFIYFSYRIWKGRITQLLATLKEFDA